VIPEKDGDPDRRDSADAAARLNEPHRETLYPATRCLLRYAHKLVHK
jgi:hypothetical protein